jgi:hypothetical protein
MLDYFKKFKKSIDFMDGRDRIDLSTLCTGEAFHIDEFAFLSGENGDYAVFIVKEVKDHFLFGNSVVTDVLKQIETDGMEAELKEVGVVFEKVTSKKNRDYIAMRFVD